MYRVTPGTKASGNSGPPLSSDVNQAIDILAGRQDAGTITFASPVTAPASAGTAVATTGTALGIGAYTYSVTFVTGHMRADGTYESTLLETTEGPTWSVTTTSGNQAVSITSLPTSASTTVVGKRLYRTAVGGSQRKLVATLPAGQTSYVDTTTDASLGANVPTTNTTGTTVTGLVVDQVVANRPAPGAGVQAYWTFEQGGNNEFMFGLDTSGNLVLQRYSGGSWTTVATFPLAGGVVTGLNADQVDSYHAGTAGAATPSAIAVADGNGRVGDSNALGGQSLAQVQAFAIAMAVAL